MTAAASLPALLPSSMLSRDLGEAGPTAPPPLCRASQDKDRVHRDVGQDEGTRLRVPAGDSISVRKDPGCPTL